METNRFDNIPNISRLDFLDIDTEKEWQKFRTEAGIGAAEAKTFRLSSVFKIAASVVLIAGATLFTYKSINQPHQDTFIAECQAIETVVENSTKISINKNSEVICTEQTDGIYDVKLKGEAYFDVEKNPDRTFRITTEDITVIVHGTSFDVCEQDNQTVVTVTSGNVEVRNNKTDKAVTDITKGKQLTCKKDGEMTVKDVENFNDIAWKFKKFEFNNQAISEVISELSKVYDFKYSFTSNDIKNITLTGTFDNQNLQSIFNVLEQTLDIKIENNNGEVKIGK
ncbi:MAG: FecR domain-containing protein [Bacteroidales bacterium]|jgi:ferric-dicitrate binding protein FerR (iron transport regulator)|nr:FecR domain-containing protein [Bacteroidales bacterium]